VQSKVAELGQATLSLYRGGVLSDPTVAALTEEITALEAQVQQQKDKLEAVRNEQYQPAVQPTSPAASEPAAQPDAAAAEPASSLAAPAPSEPAASGTIACPHCHTEVKATVTFCPECGNRIK
jgi:biotin carboxyl carrier protein